MALTDKSFVILSKGGIIVGCVLMMENNRKIVMHRRNRALSLLVLISLATILLPIQSMEPPKKSIQGQIIKSFSKSPCSALHIGFVGCIVGCIVTRLIITRVDWGQKEDASDSVSEFVRATLHEHGVAQDKIDAIKIKNNSYPNGWEAAYGYMGVPELDMWSLLYLKRHQLSSERGSVEREINVSKAAVLHEYGHIINKDTLRLGGAVILSPFVAYGLLEIPHRVIKKCPSVRLSPIRMFTIEILRINAAILMATKLALGHQKYREYNADKVVVQLCQNSDILQDEGEWYLQRHKDSPFSKISNPSYQKQYNDNVFFRELCYWWKMPKDGHLSDLTRGEDFLHAAESLRIRQLEKIDTSKKE